jgi:hypothetical protein
MREVVIAGDLRHLIHFPVTIGDVGPARFIFDTGIGVNLVSNRLLARLGLRPTGVTHTGRRMSGQEITTRLYSVPRVTFGSYSRTDVTVGALDMDLPSDLNAIEGFLSPGFFGSVAFTISRRPSRLVLEDVDSLADLRRNAVAVPLEVRWDGPCVSLFVALSLPDGSEVNAEVDTGSDCLILHSRFMDSFGLRPGSSGLETRRSTDETGFECVRHFAEIPGSVRLRDAPEIGKTGLRAMFQDIIYDGLLGDSFLGAFDVTCDLARSRLLFSNPGSGSPHL